MRKILSEEEKQNVCKEYQETKIGIESLALKYHVGKSKIKDALAEYGIEHKKKGGQNNNETFVVDDWKIEKYPYVEGKHYIAIDYKTGFSTRDVKNRGGHLTTYIEKTYGIATPTLYDRRLYYMRTGNYWWEQWFTIKLVENPQTKCCPYCGWATIDIENKSGWFAQHLEKTHGLTISQHLEIHPEDKDYFHYAVVYKNLELDSNKDNYVTCAICGKRLSYIMPSHLKLHNVTMKEYIHQYGTSGLVSKAYHNKISEITTELNKNMTFVRRSKAEEEILAFIQNLGLDATSDRSILDGQEIDIYIPSLKVGFEYNGLVWHNEVGKPNDYHLNKTEKCHLKGISLYHIFEDEWRDHQDIVKSYIRKIVNKPLRLMASNDCKVREISQTQLDEFLTQNSLIQFSSLPTYCYGLFFDEKMVSAIGLSCINDNTFEIKSFADILNTDVIYSLKILLNNFVIINHLSNPIIKASVDRRWNNGKMYYDLGFRLIEEILPNYTYIIRNKRELPSKCEEYHLIHTDDESKSVIMGGKNIHRIYDCGALVFEKKFV